MFLFYWTKTGGEFVVGKGGVSCDILFYVAVDDDKVVIARQDRVGGKAVKEETRTVPLPDFIDAIHKLWWENAK